MNAIQVSETLQKNFIRYLLTTFNVARSDAALAAEIRRQFEVPGALFRGPFLELNPPYVKGATLRELSDEGVISQSLCSLREDINPARDRPLPPDRPLYRHQELAVRRVISERRNVVVASGTGSGKTESFLIPILDDLVSDSTKGVRALLIYPMNALVNDQLSRLRLLLKDTDITFARYTSELETSEERGRSKSPEALKNEIVSRAVIRGGGTKPPCPPQILITNYAMLEYLLLRPEDSPIFDSGVWRFVCLDEAHTYTGAQGIEVSMLLRRLKHRIKKRRGEVRCIATSATLTKDDRHAAAQFAARLFGEEFSDDDVVFGEIEGVELEEESTEPPPPLAAYCSQEMSLLRERLRESLSQMDESDTSQLRDTARAMLDSGLASADQIRNALDETTENNLPRFLWAILKANTHLHQLRAMMSHGPVELTKAARELFPEGAGDERNEAICQLVEIGAMARESRDGPSLLPARYHLFARSPQGAWLCLNPLCSGAAVEGSGWSRVYLEKRETCRDCGSAVFELTVCRDCGQTFVRGFEREGQVAVEGIHPKDTIGQRYFTWQPTVAEADPDETDELLEPNESSEVEGVDICLICRRYKNACTCGDTGRVVKLYLVKDSKGNPREAISTCPRCARTSPSGIVTALELGGNAPLAVLTEELYRFTPTSSDNKLKRKPGQGRKLLTFADSRQGAARYAAYLQETVSSTLYRHLMARAAREINETGLIPDLEELAQRCDQRAEEYGLYGEGYRFATGAERRRKKTDMRARITAEFCARTDRRHSLSALGLVSCDIDFPSGAVPNENLCGRFGLSPEASIVAIQALVDTMRLDKAVTMPEGVGPDDDVFGRNTFVIRYKLLNPASAYERNWIGKSDRQTRFDYVLRILQATGGPAGSLDVQDALQGVWDWLHEQGVFVGDSQAGYQINVSRFVFLADERWYRCSACFRLSRRLLSESFRICTSRGCVGELRTCQPSVEFVDDHYRYIFDRQPIGMRVEEHTAQLQPELGRAYQDSFINGEINVLSCSTTFELGVDVGELQTVVLNNVPPTVANYRQRSGRAGRRTGGTALILTYAAARPHDRVYFADPPLMISGEVAVPTVGVDNEIITARHLNAALLGHFLRYLDGKGRVDLSVIGSFFAPNLPNGRHVDFIERWRGECAQAIHQVVDRLFAENPDIPLETSEQCVRRLCNELQDCTTNFEGWLSEYEALRDHYTSIADHSNDRNERRGAEKMRKRFIALRDRLLDEKMIDFLCSAGVLPSYSFPIDVVKLRLPSGGQYGAAKEADKSLRLERDKRIAIVEFAPGAEIVADKHIWKSVGLIIRRELNDYYYRVCNTCRNLERSARGGLPISGACRVCGDTQPGPAYRYADPDGFTTDLTAEPREAGLQVNFGINRSRFFLLAEGQRTEREEAIPVTGAPIIRYAYRRDGQLVALNSGEDPDGFLLCETCGIKIDAPRRSRKKSNDGGHMSPWGQKCSGTSARYHLGHAFPSDTLHLRFVNTVGIEAGSQRDLSFWRSVTYALLEGASLALQIERRDLDGVVRPFPISTTIIPADNYSHEVVLFDNVPGGAGHVRSIAENIEAVLRRSLVIVQCPACEEETSCRSCLRNYWNQIYWDELRRGTVARFLQVVINDAFEIS